MLKQALRRVTSVLLICGLIGLGALALVACDEQDTNPGTTPQATVIRAETETPTAIATAEPTTAESASATPEGQETVPTEEPYPAQTVDATANPYPPAS